jgi:pilus assembly protein CpaB
MRGRTLFLFLVALLLAGGTAMLVRSRLERPKVTVAAAAPRPVVPHKSVLVARIPIDRGQLLKAADLSWQVWPENGATEAYVVAGTQPAGAFNGWVAREPFVAGEPIIRGEIVAPGDRGFLAAVLSPGMRAVSVPVSITSGIAGFVFPGDRVDVLTTYTLPAADGGSRELARKVAETILRDVRVIAIDQNLQAKSGQAMLAHTVTLEVTPKESEILALAGDLGQLSLSLRGLAAARGETPPGATPDAGADNFTLDRDVSRLIANDQVTIIRGGGTATNAVDAQAAARGR